MMFLGELCLKFVKGEFLFSFQEFGDIVIYDTIECLGICIEDAVYKPMIYRIQFVDSVDGVFIAGKQDLELVFGEIRNVKGFRIGNICLHDCFEVELVNLDTLLFDRKKKIKSIEQMDLLRIRQL